MKSYQNPQPQAVEKANKIPTKGEAFDKKKNEKKARQPSLEASDKEIFQNESEEQAWADSLKKEQEN